MGRELTTQRYAAVQSHGEVSTQTLRYSTVHGLRSVGICVALCGTDIAEFQTIPTVPKRIQVLIPIVRSQMCLC